MLETSPTPPWLEPGNTIVPGSARQFDDLMRYEGHAGGRAAWVFYGHNIRDVSERLTPHPNAVEVFDQYPVGEAQVFLVERVPGVSLQRIGQRHRELIARVHGASCPECGKTVHAFRTGWGIQVMCAHCGGMFDPAAMPPSVRPETHVLLGSPMWLEHAVALARRSLDALIHFNDAGLPPRGVSPNRVIVSGEGVVKVVDPNLAQLASPDRDIVTPRVSIHHRYVSPELARGVTVPAASDVFSMGLMLFELTTGQHAAAPWDTEFKLVSRIILEPLPSPSSLLAGYPADLETLVTSALATNPDERPSLRELAESLDALASRRELDLGAGHLLEYVRCLASPDHAWIDGLPP